MASINWDSQGKRYYDLGLDRGVLYTYGNPGVPWFGLRTIEESSSGGDIQSYYLDGVKYLQISGTEEFSATISAISYPKEFLSCEGINTLAKGLLVAQQKRTPFSISYRTMVSSDVSPTGASYKIHLVYNALAKPSSRTHATLQQEPSMESFSWECETKPVRLHGLKPLSHLIVDSSEANPAYLAVLEKYLYGSATNEPMILRPEQIAAILSGEEVSF